MQKALAFVENNLLLLAVVTAALGLLVPSLGMVLESGISPLLALLMLVISLTFDAHAVKLVFRKPSRQLWALGLVYGPMSLAGWLTGRLFFGSGPLAAGQTLVGTLPTDVSAPLLVLLARGNVALAAVLNAVNTVLSPFIVPILFLLLTGIELQVPIGAIIMELVLIVVLPTVIGVYLRTRYPEAVGRHDGLYPSLGSVLYLLLLLAVCAFHGRWASIPRHRGQPFQTSGRLADRFMESGLSHWVKQFRIGGAFSHALSGKCQAMGVVDEAVEDGVCQSWVADGLVPVLNRKLAGDDRRAPAVTVFEDFEQIAPLR